MSWQTSKILVAMIAVFSGSSSAWGWQNSNIVQVEEEWEMHVLTSDPIQDAPQVSTWMSPVGDLDGVHFGFDLNHTRQSNDVGGGYQIKAQSGDTLQAEKVHATGTKLQHQDEVVRWTQVMAVHGGQLHFSVKNGTSQSFGSFGGTETRVSLTSPIANLNAYNPVVSQSASGVGFASNRVAFLKLVKVRKMDANGGVTEITVEESQPTELAGVAE